MSIRILALRDSLEVVWLKSQFSKLSSPRDIWMPQEASAKVPRKQLVACGEPGDKLSYSRGAQPSQGLSLDCSPCRFTSKTTDWCPWLASRASSSCGSHLVACRFTDSRVLFPWTHATMRRFFLQVATSFETLTSSWPYCRGRLRQEA